MEKTFNDLTKAELLQLCEDFDITANSKMTNAELVALLDAYNKGEETTVGPAETTPTKTAVTRTQAELPLAERIKLQKADLTRKEHVIINDNQSTQTKVNVLTVTWGNTGGLGIQTDIVHFNKPWYVRRGALANMRRATCTIPKVTETGEMGTEVIPRFSIQDLDGLNEQELKLLGNKQAIRNAGM